MRARNLFVKVLGQVRDTYGFALVGFVVMPEHVHLLIGEPAKGTPSTPVKRGLVSSPRNWLWSSYAWYEGKDDGLIRVDPV